MQVFKNVNPNSPKATALKHNKSIRRILPFLLHLVHDHWDLIAKHTNAERKLQNIGSVNIIVEW